VKQPETPLVPGVKNIWKKPDPCTQTRSKHLLVIRLLPDLEQHIGLHCPVQPETDFTENVLHAGTGKTTSTPKAERER